MTNNPINPKTKKLTKSFSQASSGPIQDIKSSQRNQYVNNNYDGQTEFYAVVLRTESEDKGSLWARGVSFGYNTKNYIVRARIPRLHDGQIPPVPKVDKTMPNRNREGIIDLHPTFEGSGHRVPKQGDIIRVTFLDRFNSSIRSGNGRILEIIASSEKGVPGDAEVPGVSCKSSFAGCPKKPQVNITKKLLQEIEKYERRDPSKNPSQRVLDLAEEITEEEEPAVGAGLNLRLSPLEFPPLVIVAGETDDNATDDGPADPAPSAAGESPNCKKTQTVGEMTSGAETTKKAEQASDEYIYPVDPMGPLGDWRNGTQQWRVTSKYGYRTHPVSGRKKTAHRGVDIGRGGKKWGKGEIDLKPCYSSLDGIVYVGFQSSWKERIRNGKKERYKSGAGWFVRVHHAQYGKLYTLHMHLKNPLVRSGDYVKAGQQLGIVDNTGGSTGPHNHFEVREGGTSGKKYHTDPKAFLSKKFKKKTGFDWTKVKKSKNSKGYFQLGTIRPPNGSEP